jgi:putative phosphoribosyl transferase
MLCRGREEIEMSTTQARTELSSLTLIPIDGGALEGELIVPQRAGGIVIFAHGSGSSRYSPRNQFVARTVRESGSGTLLIDLLTAEEEQVDRATCDRRFDIGLLANRLISAARFLSHASETRSLRVGFFGASTGAGAALVAAAEMGDEVGAVVSRGGRPDLAGESLMRVTSPTLLLVGGRDEPVVEFNKRAYDQLRCTKELKIISGATHFFEEPGALNQVARLAADWFKKHFRADELARWRLRREWR